MITLPRLVARQFRALLRKSVLSLGPRGPTPVVRLVARPDGLTLTAYHAECTLRYHLPGSFSPDAIVIPAGCLADFEAARGIVEIETTASGKGRARWSESGIEFETVPSEGLPELPAEPTRYAETGFDLLSALAEASQAAA